ncbi:hypothetical protein IJX73_00050 [bacterium]|nr:hypothetical protein [bacterium]MBQ9149302.1 hypothetical protein [bacterium]
MQVERCSYFIPTKQLKRNGQELNSKDMFDLGYMAGRFGVNLDGNPNEENQPVFYKNGVALDINSCTCDLFEENLCDSGIRFDVLG